MISRDEAHELMTFYLLNHRLLPTPYNHRFFVEKFAQGFAHHGFEMQVVRRIGDIREPGFVMISNHDFADGLADGPLAPIVGLVPALRSGSKRTRPIAERGKLWALRRLARQLRASDGIVVLAWFWHPAESLLDSLGIPVVFTGESYWREPRSPSHREWRAFNMRRSDAIPIEFAAAVDPERVGDGCTNLAIDCSFVGSAAYKPDWQEAFRANPRNRIVGTPPYIAEDERLDIFRNSRVVLGLHQEPNIANALPIERVYEGLAFGAVVVTDNPSAVDATDGLARYAATLDEAMQLVGHYASNEQERLELRDKGFEFICRRGTYAHRATEFIEFREKLLTQMRSV